MSTAAPVRCQTIEDVDLPAPATKLIITQHLEATQDSPFWAWIIVGAFYDRDNNIVWSTEVFAGHLDVENSDEESGYGESGYGESLSTSSEETGLSDTEESYSSSDLYYSDREDSSDDLNFDLQHHREEALQVRQVFPHWYETTPYVEPYVDTYAAAIPQSYATPPETWDPTRQGPVPGYWQASFDPDVGRWVHTWQPLC